MRKLLQASLLALALTASIHAGEIGQPVVTGEIGQPIAAHGNTVSTQGDMPNGIIEISATIIAAVLSLF